VSPAAAGLSVIGSAPALRQAAAKTRGLQRDSRAAERRRPDGGGRWRWAPPRRTFGAARAERAQGGERAAFPAARRAGHAAPPIDIRPGGASPRSGRSGHRDARPGQRNVTEQGAAALPRTRHARSPPPLSIPFRKDLTPAQDDTPLTCAKRGETPHAGGYDNLPPCAAQPDGCRGEGGQGRPDIRLLCLFLRTLLCRARVYSIFRPTTRVGVFPVRRTCATAVIAAQHRFRRPGARPDGIKRSRRARWTSRGAPGGD
jgi:hypothetical protein